MGVGVITLIKYFRTFDFFFFFFDSRMSDAKVIELSLFVKIKIMFLSVIFKK